MLKNPSVPFFKLWQLCLLWIFFLLLSFCLDAFRVDLQLADWIYNFNQKTWLWRNNFIPAVVIHKWGKYLSILMALVALGCIAISLVNKNLILWRKPISCLLLAVLLSTLMVSLLKMVTNIDCPWNLTRYGGEYPYSSIWQHLFAPFGHHHAACFPAGHASAGYAWVALYPFFYYTKPEWRWKGLVLGLSMGLVFGLGQQLRGAHFLSHDLWTLMICWSLSVVSFQMFYGINNPIFQMKDNVNFFLKSVSNNYAE